MGPDELREHITRMREELDREREERNYFQLERDRISTFWEITKRQLEEKKAELRNKDRELEDAEEQHQAEIKVCLFVFSQHEKVNVRFRFTNKKSNIYCTNNKITSPNSKQKLWPKSKSLKNRITKRKIPCGKKNAN